MGYKELFAVLFLFGCASSQNLRRVCVRDVNRCQILNRDGTGFSCEQVATRVECAAKLASNAADVGFLNEEEVILLGQMSGTADLRVVSTVRDANRQEEVAFETVAIVPSTHTGGLEGLRGGRYCHPGLGASDIRWSPRVLKALELAAARTDRCEGSSDGKTAEEMEVETLSNFFSAACRPGPWSYNSTVDTDLKSRFPNLCSLCTAPGVCAGYNMDSSVNIAGVSNSNRHIQALECLRNNGTVAYVAWQHAREFFTIRNPDEQSRFSVLCDDGSLVPFTAEALAASVSPCAFVRQPWGAIVTSAAAASIGQEFTGYWPQGADTGLNNVQSALFRELTGGVENARVVIEANPASPLNYTSRFRVINSIDSTASCLPARRWCTLSAQEQNKCQWVRTAAYTLGLQPTISCQQRLSPFECLTDIMESRVDFLSLDTHYGYLARRHYRLSAVKLVMNQHASTSRVAALVKDSNIANINRFANLRNAVACFPEFGGLAFVAFLRRAQQLSVISETECDYGKAVGEFFSEACAPGATDSSHSISDSSDFSTRLCTACRLASPAADGSNFTCAWNSTNAFYGNTGSLRCLAAAHTDVAVVEMQNINAQLQLAGLNATDFRVLCQNDTLVEWPGVANIDDGCLLTHVVDAEVLTRRNDPMWNSINAFLDALDELFGFNTMSEQQLINLHIYNSFNGVSDLLFKDSTTGVTEPSSDTSYAPASNYIDLFRHLESCTSAAPSTTTPGPGGHATRNVVSLLTIAVMGMMARFVIY